MNRILKRTWVPFLLISLALGACTQKRKQTFEQGQGTDLDPIAMWQPQFTDLDTGDVIGLPPTTNAQDSVTISDQVRSMNHYNLVEINVKDPKYKTLVGTPPFRGKPHTHGVYQIEIKLTQNYLKILKVAKKEDLPFEEHFYIEDTLPDGRVAIPLLGYKVKGFFRVEPKKNDDDQNSHHLIEISVPDMAQATHVRIDWNSREIFEPVKQTDLFPANLFFSHDAKSGDWKPYEWYYSETVTEKSLSDTDTIVGENNTRSDHSTLSPATKVVFIPRQGEIRAVNVALDERLSRDQIEKTADLNSKAALVLPVQWKDYRTKPEGSNLSLKGEALEERKWNQRQYFEIDFPNLQSASISEGKTRLLDVEVDRDYVSFTVMNLIGDQGREIKYSFLRADDGRLAYQPKISDEKDRRTFGFFTTEKPYVDNWEYYTKDDYRKRVYMNRMNPAQKEIVFHLSTDSPAWLEDITQMAVKAWDQAFEEALGKNKIHIVYSPDRVSLGDLRYNVIHLVDTLDEDGLLGFGPSIADPETGEIIAASTNIYVNSIQSVAANSVRQYMIDRLEGRIGKETLSSGPILTDDASPRSSSVGARHALASLPLLQGKHTDFDRLMSTLALTPKERREQAMMADSDCSFAEQAAMSANDRDIQKFCPAIEKIVQTHQSLSFLGESAEQNWESVWESSKDAIRDCSKQITREKLLSTLIHELGHDFGLRHNFYGSYDKANFKQITTIFGEKTTAPSSSIMEYTDWGEDRLDEAGPYDIAAIRFGYGNSVELKDGSFISVGQDSIEKALTSKNRSLSDLKPYLFCSDEEASSGMDALCRPYDSGTTPDEIVKFFIRQYERSQTLRRYRRALPNTLPSQTVAKYNFNQVFTPLRAIYDQWRMHLGEYAKKSNRYLDAYDSTSFQALLDGMKNDPQYGAYYDQYYQASRDIYAFFKKIVFQPNQYCLIDQGGTLKAIEFLTLRDRLSEESRGSLMIRSCAEATSLGGKALKVVSEIGSPVQSYRYTKYDSVDDLSDDVMGNAETREYAALAIASRFSSAENELNQFNPSMLDEPAIREDFVSTLLDRIVNGVDLKAYGIETPQPLFNAEAEIFKTVAQTLTYGLSVPGDQSGTVNKVATLNRLDYFSVYNPTPGEDLSKMAAVLNLNGIPAYAAVSQDRNVMATRLIRRYNQIDRQLRLKPADEKEVQSLSESLQAALPSSADAAKWTLQDFATLAKVVDSVAENNAYLLSCLGSQKKGIAQLSALTQTFDQILAQTQPEGEEAMTKLAQTPLQKLLQAVQQPGVAFDAESVGSLTDAAKACLQKQNGLASFNQEYAKDLEAQKGLILNILGMY